MTTKIQRWLSSEVRSTLFLGLTLSFGCNEVSFSKKNTELEQSIELVETFIQSPLPQIDVLWVIDNSQSMAQEHTALQESVDLFMEKLEDSDIEGENM